MTSHPDENIDWQFVKRKTLKFVSHLKIWVDRWRLQRDSCERDTCVIACACVRVRVWLHRFTNFNAWIWKQLPRKTMDLLQSWFLFLSLSFLLAEKVMLYLPTDTLNKFILTKSALFPVLFLWMYTMFAQTCGKWQEIFPSFIKWMSEWMNEEWMNEEWMNEWTNEWMNETSEGETVSYAQ